MVCRTWCIAAGVVHIHVVGGCTALLGLKIWFDLFVLAAVVVSPLVPMKLVGSTTPHLLRHPSTRTSTSPCCLCCSADTSNDLHGTSSECRHAYDRGCIYMCVLALCYETRCIFKGEVHRRLLIKVYCVLFPRRIAVCSLSVSWPRS